MVLLSIGIFLTLLDQTLIEQLNVGELMINQVRAKYL